jgi:hypothetical protein
MVGWLEWDDSAKVAAFRRAMAPMDEHRRNMGSGAAAEDEEETEGPSDPVPAVENATPAEDRDDA